MSVARCFRLRRLRLLLLLLLRLLASSGSQWALPDFICQLQIAVGTAGLHPRAPDRSGHCRTSVVSSRSQWAVPDFSRDCQIPVGNFNREPQIAVGPAGLQPRAPDRSGHCQTSAWVHECFSEKLCLTAASSQTLGFFSQARSSSGHEPAATPLFCSPSQPMLGARVPAANRSGQIATALVREVVVDTWSDLYAELAALPTSHRSQWQSSLAAALSNQCELGTLSAALRSFRRLVQWLADENLPIECPDPSTLRTFLHLPQKPGPQLAAGCGSSLVLRYTISGLRFKHTKRAHFAPELSSARTLAWKVTKGKDGQPFAVSCQAMSALFRSLLTLPPLALSAEEAANFSAKSMRWFLPSIADALQLSDPERNCLGNWQDGARLPLNVRYSAERLETAAGVRRLCLAAIAHLLKHVEGFGEFFLTFTSFERLSPLRNLACLALKKCLSLTELRNHRLNG
eukprot:s1316_g2.t1